MGMPFGATDFRSAEPPMSRHRNLRMKSLVGIPVDTVNLRPGFARRPSTFLGQNVGIS